MTALAMFSTVTASLSLLFMYLTNKEEELFLEDLKRLEDVQETIKKTKQARKTYAER